MGQKVAYFLLLLQIGCCFTVDITASNLNANRAAYRARRSVLRSKSEIDACAATFCGQPPLNHQGSLSQYQRCVLVTCSLSAPPTNKQTPPISQLNDEFMSVTPLIVQGQSELFSMNICPVSALYGNQLMKYCTLQACWTLTSSPMTSTAKLLMNSVQDMGEGTTSTYTEKLWLNEPVSLCMRSKCRPLALNSRAFRRCVTELCCFADSIEESVSQPDGEEPEVDVEGEVDKEGAELQGMTRKRRVNDDVSQCIQSYCSGKTLPDRLRCTVKNCHRPGAA